MDFIQKFGKKTDMELIHENKKLSIWFRLLEGATTMMLIGYILGGGCILTPLGVVYIIHWISSINYHLFPSLTSMYIDIHFIDMVVMERISYKIGDGLIHMLFILALITNINSYHRLVMYIKVIIIVILLLIMNIQFHPLYKLNWFMAGVFYLTGDILIHYSVILKSISHICFHIFLSLSSYLEIPYYRDHRIEAFTLTRIITCIIYIYYASKIYYKYEKV